MSSVPLKIAYNAHVTAGTPVASKGTVTNNSITVTPSVTNVTGYITGGTIVGTPVTVDVTELESGTKSITANGTGISVSGYSAVDVNVSSGSSWDLLTSDEFIVSTTSTTKITVGTIDLSAYIPSFNKGDILWFHIRDKAGPRNGYFYGSDCFFVIEKDGTSPSNANPPCYTFKYNSDAYGKTTGSYGLYCYNVSKIQCTATINAKYDSTYSLTINGTFKVDVYKLNADSSMTMFQ